jgi:hypothetical protein
MNLLSRRSVLAIAAVGDVALQSRSAPVAAKALAARHKLPPVTWRLCSRGWSTPRSSKACVDRGEATSWRASADA